MTRGLAVTNPRISAGSTVVSTGAALGGSLRELDQVKRSSANEGKTSST